MLTEGGSAAIVGVQRGTGQQFTQFECNQGNSLTNGMLLTFSQPPCNTPTFTAAPSNSPTDTPTNTPTITATRTITDTPTNTNTPTNTPTPGPCAGAYHYLVPHDGVVNDPPNGGTVPTGQQFSLDLILHR